MSWIKRNLYFLVSGGIAAALLGLAGYYCYSKWQLNKDNLTQLEDAYRDWERIALLNPNPGNDKVNNIQVAREQREQVRAMMAKVEKYFTPVPPIPKPDKGTITKEEFASALRRTIDQLQNRADETSIKLPPKFNFSFDAQRSLTIFAPGSLDQLSKQLGDIKVICGILFDGKINALDTVSRERVSSDDLKGTETDYLDATITSVTNDLAVLVPYQVNFECFSAELADVLAGFGRGTRGFVVKSVNVEPSDMSETPGGMMAPGMVAPGMPPGTAARQNYEMEMEGARTMSPGPYANRYANRYGNYPVAVPAAAVAARGGLPTVLDEKQLKVTLLVDVVRLLPKK